MHTALPIHTRARQDARRIFTKALEAVEAGNAVCRHLRMDGDRLFFKDLVLSISQFQRCIAIGAGKASAAMGQAVEGILKRALSDGYITVKYGHGHPLDRIHLNEAGHPIPDARGVAGAAAILDTVRKAGSEDLIIALFSGGGSALLPLPMEGISLGDKQETISVLLQCGASIHEINTIRKHLSRIKGGRLAKAAHPARLVALILSDVVGDDLDVIASGPTVPDPSTFSDCMEILSKYHLEDRLPSSVTTLLRKGHSRQVPETPKPGDPAFEKTTNIIIGNNSNALLAAKTAAEDMGYHTLILSSGIQGDTREAARFHAAIAREIRSSQHPIPPPACILSGGETTVQVTGTGKGGRNQEFVLQAALDIAGAGPIVVLSAGTDGTDGPTDAAGAVADDASLSRARAAGMDPVRFLENNDTYSFFKAINDLVITGPTDTNVMDLRIMLAP